MNNNKAVVSFISLFLLLANATFAQDLIVDGAPTLNEEKRSYKGAIPGKYSQFPKVSGQLLQLQTDFAVYQSQYVKGSKKDPFTPQIQLMRTSGGYIVVDAIASGEASALASDLVGMGAMDVVAYKSIVSARIPISAIQSLNNLSSLQFVRPFYAITNVGATTSQGDVAQTSDLLRTAETVDGTGIIVGVLSDSYDCLSGEAAGIVSGDLPADVNVLLDEAGCSSGSDEGRGMLEIVYDVAPGAGLAFNTAFGGMAGFASGITNLRTVANANVIVDDVFYFAEPMFEDGIIADAADAAFAAGVPYFSSAGNSATNSYAGQYTDSGATGPNGGQTHDFDPSTGISNLQALSMPVGTGFTMTFQWNQPFASLGGAGASSDVDIFVIGVDGQTVVAAGVDSNVGGDAVEVFSFNNTGLFDLDGDLAADTTFFILIEHFSGPKPDEIKYSYSGSGISIVGFPSDSGTSFGHSAAVGAVSVGAAGYSSTPAFGTSPPVRESFSSRGNVPIHFDGAGNPISPPNLRLKPEITAPDGANTTFFGSSDPEVDGFPNFFGTSAAAPHAAGAAALLLEVDGTLTPSEIYRALENSAIDMSTAGYDFDTGFGLIQADVANAALANNAPVIIPIASQAASTGDAALVFALSATDSDADAIAFSQVGMPGYCALTDIGGGSGDITCTVTGSDFGRTAVVVTATDNGTPARAHSQGFYVIANPNSPPVLTGIGAQGMDDNANLNFALTASDPDGDTLAFAFPTLPSFCIPTDNGDGSGSIDCNPGYNNTGVYAISVAAVDNGVPSLNDGEGVVLTINNVNRDPVLASIGPKGMNEGTVAVINVSATESDIPDAVTFSSAGEPSFCSFVDNLNGTAALTCSATFADAGIYDITITATDSFAGSDGETFALTVSDVNLPPVVDFIGNRAISNTDVLIVPVSSTDPEGDTITLSDSGLPGFCGSIADNGDGTGSITCTPGGANNGTYNNLTATATDDGVGTLSTDETFTLVVGDPGTVNNAPVLGLIGPQNVNDTDQLVIPLSVSDIDGGDTHAFSETGRPAFCSALVDNGNDTGSITCNPTFGDEGVYPMSVRVDDNGTPVLSDTEQFAITVIHLNAPPVANAGPDQDAVPAVAINLDGSGSTDAEGGVTYSWRFQTVAFGSSLTDVSISNPTTATPSFVADVDGKYLLELTVTDVDSATDTDTVLISVDTPKFLYLIDRLNNRITLTNAATGASLGDRSMSLAGQTITGGSGLAVHPITNVMYAALVLSGDFTTRELVTLDPLTGVATSIGDMGDNVLGLSFDSFGTLYAVSGDDITFCTSGPATTTPETLFTVDQMTGAMTFVQTLGNGTCGETIAYNTNDQTLYHMSGNGDQVFETIDLDAGTTTNISFSGDPIPAFYVRGIDYDESRDLFVGVMFNFGSSLTEYYSITPSGSISTIASPLGGNFAWDDLAFWDPNFQALPALASDLDGDRRSDILWRNLLTGRNVVHFMDGANVIGNETVGSVSIVDWLAVGNGDYDGDGDADVLWRNTSSGRNVVHLMDGATISGNSTIGTVFGGDWQVVGNGDYNGDLKSDILWRNVSSGRNVMHLMDGSTIQTDASISTISDLNWQVYANGDFNGDGKSDILWRNSSTNRYVIHMMDGVNVIDNPTIGYISVTLWDIAAIGDFNGDGKDDIYWRSTSTGRNVVHLMNGSEIIGNSTVGTIPDQLWEVVGSGDYNGDGRADILWRHSTSGRNVVHLMNGATIIGNTTVGTIPNTPLAPWEAVHID